MSVAIDAAEGGSETGFLTDCASEQEGFAEVVFAEKFAAAAVGSICTIVENIEKVAESSEIVASKDRHF